MPPFFPRHTLEFRLEEPKAFRRLTLNLTETALLTGVVVRLFRSVALTHGFNSWLYLGGTVSVGILFVCGMATAHLSNYPLYRWSWRAPLFGLVESAGEMAVSFLLIWAGREPEGTARAEFHDWWSMAWSTLWIRGLGICAWALLLAAIVMVVRRYIHSDDPQ